MPLIVNVFCACVSALCFVWCVSWGAPLWLKGLNLFAVVINVAVVVRLWESRPLFYPLF